MKSIEVHPTAILGRNAEIEDGVSIGPYSIINDGVRIGRNTRVGPQCIIGESGMSERGPTMIGADSIIRAGTIIYAGVHAKDRLETGPRVFIRENTKLGKNVRVGTLSDIEGDCTFGDYCRLHSNVFVAKGTSVSDCVWMFPHVVITNDPHPPSELQLGVVIERFAVIAAGSVVMAGVRIGEDAVVGAMSLVRKDVQPGTVVVGNPAKEMCEAISLRNKLDQGKSVYPWRYHFDRGMPWEGIGYDNWKSRNEDG